MNRATPGTEPETPPETPPPGAPPTAPPAPDREAPIGPLASLLVGLAVLAGYLLVQSVLIGLLAAVGGAPEELARGALEERIRQRAGFLFSIATCAAAPLAVAAVVGLTWLWASGPQISDRRAAAAVRRHLGLRIPPLGGTLLWLAATAGAMAVYEVASRWLQRPPMPDFMLELHGTAGSMWLLGAAVVVAAPAVEEMLFRGFLLPGLAAGRLGDAGAVAVTALLWAVIHFQYDAFDMGAIVVLGVLFGVARLATGSTWVPFLLHLAVNLLAMVQLVWSLGWS